MTIYNLYSEGNYNGVLMLFCDLRTTPTRLHFTAEGKVLSRQRKVRIINKKCPKCPSNWSNFILDKNLDKKFRDCSNFLYTFCPDIYTSGLKILLSKPFKRFSEWQKVGFGKKFFRDIFWAFQPIFSVSGSLKKGLSKCSGKAPIGAGKKSNSSVHEDLGAVRASTLADQAVSYTSSWPEKSAKNRLKSLGFWNWNTWVCSRLKSRGRQEEKNPSSCFKW